MGGCWLCLILFYCYQSVFPLSTRECHHVNECQILVFKGVNIAWLLKVVQEERSNIIAAKLAGFIFK